MKQYDIKKIQELVDAGKLMCQSHPTLPLKIYKYTVETQFSKDWDDVTIRCRGLVLDEQGIAWNNPIPKFFNWEEVMTSTPNVLRRSGDYEITDKVDGSCIEVFYYKEHLIVCTLGSFESDQAKIAKQLLATKYLKSTKQFDKNFTYIFELIVPENRIVLDYGDEEKLVLIAIRDNETDSDFTLPIGFPVVDKINMNIEQLFDEKKRPDFINKEGFVIKYTDGYRVKVKYEEYFRLHKIMTGVTPRFIWEFLKEGKSLPLENVPDEFYKYVIDVKVDLETKFCKIGLHATDIFNFIPKEGISRKEFALIVLKSYKEISAILFKMWESKPYDELIWNMIRPEAEKSKFNSLKEKEDN